MRYILNGMKNHLMGSVCFNAPEIHGMPSFGDGTGTQQPAGGNQQQQFDDQHGHVPIFGQEGDDEDSDLKDVLEGFKLGDDEDDEFDDTQDRSQGLSDIPQDQVTALNQKIESTIKNMRIPDGAIPEDFDVSDRTQLTNLMNRTVQAAVAQSLQVVFQPVQMALQHMVGQLDGRIDAKIAGSRDQMSAHAILEQMVPEINDPRHKGLVMTLNETLKSNGKKANERAKLIRKTLNSMGIKAENAQGGGRRMSNPNGGGNNQSVRTGAAALDSFFGSMPKFK